MSSRKHRGAENIENLCPVSRKRSTSKNSAVGAAASVSATKTSIYEYTSSPSVLTFEALEEMGIGMLDSEESSSSAMSAIALAVSATSDENSNETTPCPTAPRMNHQPQSRMSLNSTASTLDNSTVNTTIIEALNEDAQERLLHSQSAEKLHSQSTEKLHALVQAKRTEQCSSNSNSPSKRTRNPLSTVTCNSQNEAQSLLPPPVQLQQQSAPSLSLLPSTSKQAQLRQQKKNTNQSLIKHMTPTENFFVYRIPTVAAHLSSGINHFERISDEILMIILRYLPKKTLLRLGCVCRRFNRCVHDDSLWTRLDLGSRTLSPYALDQVIRSGVMILRLAQAEIQDPAFLPENLTKYFFCRLNYLDLSLATVSLTTLQSLFGQCRDLRKLSLENCELNDAICFQIGQNTLMETLNLSMASGLSPHAVRVMIGPQFKLNSLNISWTDICDDGLTALVTYCSSQLMRLNIAGCRRVLFDEHLQTLQRRCPQLLELDLSDCNCLTPAALNTIKKFKSLEYLSVSRCYLIPATSFIELKHMDSLTYLDIFGMLSDAAMEVLEKQMPKIGINKFIHSSVGRPTVGSRRTSIWGLRTRD